jgi:hypothetical protein
MRRLAARFALVEAGNEALEMVQKLAAADRSNSSLQELVIWLSTRLEIEARHKFAWRLQEILCPYCLTRFEPHQVKANWDITHTHYGCRVCRQSKAFIADVSQVTAVLDSNWVKAHQRQVGRLRVNWLLRRDLFDFDTVEIIQASDEDVERFAVQVGNDTDPVRRRRYPKMVCMIRPGCQLSENTIRILQRTFGQVRGEA